MNSRLNVIETIENQCKQLDREAATIRRFDQLREEAFSLLMKRTVHSSPNMNTAPNNV